MFFSVKHGILSSLPNHNAWNSNTLVEYSVIFLQSGGSPSVNKPWCKIPMKTKRETRTPAEVNDSIQLTLIKSFAIHFSFPHAMAFPVCLPQVQAPDPLVLVPNTVWCWGEVFPPHTGFVAPQVPQPWVHPAGMHTSQGTGWWRSQPCLLQREEISTSFFPCTTPWCVLCLKAYGKEEK